MEEVWKPINGYEEFYEVSNAGRIRSKDRKMVLSDGKRNWEYIKKGRILKPVTRQHGYLGVMLYGKGGHKTRGFKTFAVHRLVAEAFIPNPNGLPEVNHVDEDKTNNRAENLQWVSHIDNANYGTAIKRRTEKAINGILSRSIEQYTKDGTLVAEYPSIAEAERQTGFAKANICRCAQGSKQYSHAYGYIWRYASEKYRS